jgi:hypothetical protein
MNTFTKKRSYFLSLMVILVVLTLGSTAWSQTEGRLLSFIGNSYVLTVALNEYDVNSYLSDVIDPALNLSSFLGSGIVITHNRDNVRDGAGFPIDSGEEHVAILFLLVRDPAAPFPGLSLLHIKSFNSNQATIDYIAAQGLIQHYEASEVKKNLEIEVRKKGTKIKELIDFRSQQGTISLETRFVAPVPLYVPYVVPDFVSETPVRLRFSYAEEFLFSISYSRVAYELEVEKALLYFKIDGLAGWAGQLFNGLDKNDVTRLRYVRQFQVINEILP